MSQVGYGERVNEIFVQTGFAYRIQVSRIDGRYLFEFRGTVEQGTDGGYFTKFRGKRVEVIAIYGNNDFEIVVKK